MSFWIKKGDEFLSDEAADAHWCDEPLPHPDEMWFPSSSAALRIFDRLAAEGFVSEWNIAHPEHYIDPKGITEIT